VSAGERNLKGEALAAVRKAFAGLVSEERAKGTIIDVPDDAVDQVFEAAWNHQFDETPAAFRRQVKAVLKAVGGGES
jgi:hypothetical protein